MLAYPKKNLANLLIQQQASEAAEQQLITAKKEHEIKLAYPTGLYAPNFFIRIGLGLLTLFIVSAAIGLLALITSFSSANAILLLSTMGCYVALELIATGKKHFNSGVDNILMFCFTGLFAGYIMNMLPYSLQQPEWALLVICFISLYLAVRFADSIMAVIAAAAFPLFIFFWMTTYLIAARQIAPLAIVAIAAVLYFVKSKVQTVKANVYYTHVLMCVSITLLAVVYLAGNFYVVAAMADTTGITVAKGQDINLSWFYWLWTLLLPVIYLIIGIKNKSLIFARLGILALAFSLFTLFYYYPLLLPEATLVMLGATVIATVYSLIKYLQQPRQGFVFKALANDENDKINLEGLIVSEVYGNVATPAPTDTTFGGGDFGGAGAGGNY